jgi:hypothetical protein
MAEPFLEIWLEDGRMFSAFLVSGTAWSVVVWGDIVLVRDTGDRAMNETLVHQAANHISL